jgi:hypothetical protein
LGIKPKDSTAVRGVNVMVLLILIGQGFQDIENYCLMIEKLFILPFQRGHADSECEIWQNQRRD